MNVTIVELKKIIETKNLRLADIAEDLRFSEATLAKFLKTGRIHPLYENLLKNKLNELKIKLG